jgi:hypothetical protein
MDADAAVLSQLNMWRPLTLTKLTADRLIRISGSEQPNPVAGNRLVLITLERLILDDSPYK